MGYKMIVSDLDGTMFGGDYKAHRDNLLSIKKATERGVVFAIASGRPFLSALNVAEQIGLNSENHYAVCFNGAAIAEAATGRVIYSLPLQDNYAQIIIRAARENDVSVIAYIDGLPFSYRDDDEVSAYYDRVGVAVTVDESLERRATNGYNKVLLRGAPEILKKVEGELSEWAETRVSCVYSDTKMLEFFNIDASKGRAMLLLAEKLGIGRHETIAIGDYFNDLSMIDAAGLGVAIKGSPASVIAAAGYVTELSAEDGAVSEVIEKFVLARQ